MDRNRTASSLLALLFFLVTPGHAACPVPGPASGPNFIVIVADDLAWGDLPVFTGSIPWQNAPTAPVANQLRLLRPDLNRLGARMYADSDGTLGNTPAVETELRVSGDADPPPASIPDFDVLPLDGGLWAPNEIRYSPHQSCATSDALCNASDVLAGAGGLARMAHHGVAMSRFYAASAVCSPSRASILTGRHLVDHGLFRVGNDLLAREVTIAEYLRQSCDGAQRFATTPPPACYHTGLIGKWHVGAGDDLSPHAQGFADSVYFNSHRTKQFRGKFFCKVSGASDLECDGTDPTSWVAKNHGKASPRAHECNDDGPTGADGEAGIIGCPYSTRLYRDLAKKFIASAPKPFLLVLTVQAPHDPIEAPLRSTKHYKTVAAEQTRFGGAELWAMIEELDAAVGEILDSQGLANDTMVFFTSDHGRGGTGSGGIPFLREGKKKVYEGGVRVGMLAWGCDIDPDADLSRNVGSQVDLFTTIAEAAGGGLAQDPVLHVNSDTGLGCADSPHNQSPSCQQATVRGRSLLDLLQGGSAATGADFAHAQYGHGRVVVGRMDLDYSPPPPAAAVQLGVCGYFERDPQSGVVTRGGSCTPCDTGTDCDGVTCNVVGRVCVKKELPPSTPNQGTCDGNACLNDSQCNSEMCAYADDSTLGARCYKCPLGSGSSTCWECAADEECREVSVPCTACLAASWKLFQKDADSRGLYDLGTNPEEDERLNCLGQQALDPIVEKLESEATCVFDGENCPS